MDKSSNGTPPFSAASRISTGPNLPTIKNPGTPSFPLGPNIIPVQGLSNKSVSPNSAIGPPPAIPVIPNISKGPNIPTIQVSLKLPDFQNPGIVPASVMSVIPKIPIGPSKPTNQDSLISDPRNSEKLSSTVDLILHQLFGASQSELICSNCKNILGQSIMLKDFRNNILCENCFKQKMLCTMKCGNIACAYPESSSEMFCFTCSSKQDHSRFKTFFNILDNYELANFYSIIRVLDQKNTSKVHQDLISLYNSRLGLEFEFIMEQCIQLCKGYEGNRLNLVLIKYLLLMDKDQEALQLASKIKDHSYFGYAASLFLDLCSVENLLNPDFKNAILGFMEENSSIISKRMKVYKEASESYLALTCESILSNLNDFSVYLGFKKHALLIQLANGNYNGVDSYIRYLDVLLPPSIYKTKCIRSVASLTFKAFQYNLTSIIGERAIISHLLNKKNDYTGISNIAFMVAKSKIHSGKEAGVLNLLVLLYEDAEKSNNIEMMIDSCELVKEFYKLKNHENSKRVQAKIDLLRSLLPNPY